MNCVFTQRSATRWRCLVVSAYNAKKYYPVVSHVWLLWPQFLMFTAFTLFRCCYCCYNCASSDMLAFPTSNRTRCQHKMASKCKCSMMWTAGAVVQYPTIYTAMATQAAIYLEFAKLCTKSHKHEKTCHIRNCDYWKCLFIKKKCKCPHLRKTQQALILLQL